MSISGRVKELGHSICLRSGLSTFVAKMQACARIIMYHGILSRDRELLITQLRYFCRHFRVVTLEQVVDTLKAGRFPQQHDVVLTFDDGLRNNFTVAYPILKSLEIPATFFVCSGLVDTGQWLWTKEARCRLKTLDHFSLTALAVKLPCPANNVEDVVEWMKTLPVKTRKSAENTIREATPGFRPTAIEHEAYDVMNWDELKSLDPRLITVGSHTHSHPILPALDDDEVNFEMVESRRALEKALGRPVKYFCYPNGSHHPQSCAAASRTYEAAVTTESGMLDRKAAGDLYCMPRIAATPDAALMAWRLHRPGA